jgi:hypothetical protein
MSTPSLAPSSLTNGGEACVRSSRSRARVGVHTARSRSASNSSPRPCSQTRSRVRSRSSGASRPAPAKQITVRFEEPVPSAQGHARDLADTVAGLATMHLCEGGAANVATSEESALAPVRKKQRNRSASTKRRSRATYRETWNRRKRDARAPSRSRSQGNSSSINRPLKKASPRTRSRSPLDHSAHWLCRVNNSASRPSGPTMRQPPLRLIASDDAELGAVHQLIQAQLGYTCMDGFATPTDPNRLPHKQVDD